jgi:cleavage stimulation factor subunit 3
MVARNIFDMGLKSFGTELQYVLKYLDFLTSTNDDNNTRVVFEKVLADDNGLSPENALRVWNRSKPKIPNPNPGTGV